MKQQFLELSPYLKKIISIFMDYYLPPNQDISSLLNEYAHTRTYIRVALSCLYRKGSHDTDLAEKIILWVLDQQYKEKDFQLYGSWYTSIKNNRLDPNWREFIGCELILIIEYYKSLLSEPVIEKIKQALIRAAEGAKKRNVDAHYTNIAIMSAILMEYVGTNFNDPSLVHLGQKKAQDCYALYQKFGSFSEFNSPTYYGVTLFGIALWRELGPSIETRQMGAELENGLWEDFVDFYHPGLRNMAGPYFRAYGMDMRRYHSLMGLWIAIALEDENAVPFPLNDGEKFFEINNIVSYLHLGTTCSKKILDSLRSFSEESSQSRIVPNEYPGSYQKKVTAILSENWIMGGLRGNRQAWKQIKPGTIHWKISEKGDIGWLFVPAQAGCDIEVNNSEFRMYQSNQTRVITFLIQGKGLTREMFSKNCWRLPGINISVKTSLTEFFLRKIDPDKFRKRWAVCDELDSLFKLRFKVPLLRSTEEPILTLIPENP